MAEKSKGTRDYTFIVYMKGNGETLKEAWGDALSNTNFSVDGVFNSKYSLDFAKCPKCDTYMVKKDVIIEGGDIWYCSRCEGVWSLSHYETKYIGKGKFRNG